MTLKTMRIAIIAGLAAFTAAACESDGGFEEAGEDIDEALDLDD